jgi:hypothetical protein
MIRLSENPGSCRKSGSLKEIKVTNSTDKPMGRIARARLGLCLLMAATTTITAHSASVYFPPALPMPADILEQFQVQGEYFGTMDGGARLGAWVVSLSLNKYNIIYLPGGLVSVPGAAGSGWDGKTKYEGADVGPAALNATNGYKGAVSGTGENRVLKGTTQDGKSFTLNKVVRKSPTEGLVPKTEWKAKYWFRANNQGDLTNWTGSPAPVMKHDGYLYRGVTAKATHKTVFLHVEVKAAFCPTCRDQRRGNSGIYMKNMHELQVLDSFGLKGADNEAGGIYGVVAPSINAALPPQSWQTYDIYYTPTGDKNATITLYLNGVLVHDKATVDVITQGGFAGNNVYLQNHDGDSEVVYGNIWAIDDATPETLPWASLIPTTSLRDDHGQSRQRLRTVDRQNGSLPALLFGRNWMGRKLNSATSNELAQ